MGTRLQDEVQRRADAEIDGFQRGLDKRDEQIAAAKLPAGLVTWRCIDRGARIVHGNSEHRMPSGKLSAWDELTETQRDQFRIQARRVIEAAVGGC